MSRNNNTIEVLNSAQAENSEQKWFASLIILTTLLIWSNTNAQPLFQGPADGIVLSGITKTTDDFSIELHETNEGNRSALKSGVINSISELNLENRKIGNPIKFFTDPNVSNHSNSSDMNIILENVFEGPSVQNCWVPDCNIGVGPEEMIIPINTMFTITDREGNILKNIGTGTWFNGLVSGDLIFDPKVIYDKDSKRWILLYLYSNGNTQTAYHLISISDDSTALGSWNSWAFPAGLNGSTSDGTWADFPGMCVDEDAVYITTDQIIFGSGNIQYFKLRIIKKSDLLNENPEAVNWRDVWDIRFPGEPFLPAAVSRPVTLLSEYDGMLIAAFDTHVLLSGIGTKLALFHVKNPFTNFSFTGNSIQTMTFRRPPFAQQLGGGLPLQTFGLLISEPVYRNGKLHVIHSTASGTNNQFSGLHYIQIGVDSLNIKQEFIYGAEDFWYFMPAITVDLNENVFAVYNRSSLNDYAGAYFDVKLNNEESFSESAALQEGLGNSNQFCMGNGSRLRWGDYSGIALDYNDENSIWIHGEYVGSDNFWKTKIGKIKLESTTSVETLTGGTVPLEFSLNQNYPNPFNPSTIISYSLPEATTVNIFIFNSLGQKVRSLVMNKDHSAGTYQTIWKGKDDFGKQVASGIYIYRMQAGEFSQSKKLTLLR